MKVKKAFGLFTKRGKFLIAYANIAYAKAGKHWTDELSEIIPITIHYPVRRK